MCAYNDADVFDAGGIWEATGAAMGRPTEKRDAFLHNRKHAVAHTRERAGFQEKERCALARVDAWASE